MKLWVFYRKTPTPQDKLVIIRAQGTEEQAQALCRCINSQPVPPWADPVSQVVYYCEGSWNELVELGYDSTDNIPKITEILAER